MVVPSMLGVHFFRVFHDDIAVQTTSRRPAAFDRGMTRFHSRDKVVHDSVGDRFIEDAFVAKRLQVHFKAFQFHADVARNVREDNLAVVWLARLGAHGCEFRTVVFDRQIA